MKEIIVDKNLEQVTIIDKNEKKVISFEEMEKTIALYNHINNIKDLELDTELKEEVKYCELLKQKEEEYMNILYDYFQINDSGNKYQPKYYSYENDTLKINIKFNTISRRRHLRTFSIKMEVLKESERDGYIVRDYDAETTIDLKSIKRLKSYNINYSKYLLIEYEDGNILKFEYHGK